MDFVIIGNTWEAGRDNPICHHQIALELVRRGRKVLWIEGSGMRTPSLRSRRDRRRIIRKVVLSLRGVRQMEGCNLRPSVLAGALWLCSPLFIPLPQCGWIRRLNGWMCRLYIRFYSRRMGLRDPVLLNAAPVLAEAMRGRRSAASPRAVRVVYYCIDRWDAYPGYNSHVMAETDKRCCELADGILASSGVLAERCRRFNEKVRLLPHGVDHAFFSLALQEPARPADLPAGRIAGFFGSLSAWLDQDLLLELASRVPECEVVLIGRVDVPVEKLRGVRNIHLLGPRPFHRLPEYVAHFDVGLIPYALSDLTMAVNPTKLREMLSAGCPVVTTDMPETRPYVGRGVTVARTVEAFVEAVAQRMRQPLSRDEREAISRGVADETWERRVDEMLEWVG